MINMGRCCGVECVIASNDFEDNLDNMTGTGALSGGSLILDAGEQEIFDDGSASESSGTALYGDPDPSSGTAEIEFQVARVDANNYRWGRYTLTAGVGSLSVGETVGGVSSQLEDSVDVTDTGADATARHEMMLCWTPGDVISEPDRERSSRAEPDSIDIATGWTDAGNALVADGNVALYGIGGAPPVSSTPLAVFWNPMDVLPLIPRGSTITNITVNFNAGHDGSSADVEADLTLTIGGGGGAKGPIPISSGSATYVATGSPASWGFGAVSVESIYSGLIEGDIQFTDNDSGTAQITLDYFGDLIFDYETPEREPGRLIFSFKNVSDDSYQCAMSGNVLHSAGLLSGFRSNSGTWDITTSQYHYQAQSTHPECPACQECPETITCEACEDDLASIEFLVEVDGIADDYCDGCENLNANYILRFTGVLDFGVAGFVCVWRGNFDSSVGNGLGSCTPSAALGGPFVELWIGQNAGTGEWYVRGEIGMVGISGNGAFSFFFAETFADLPDCDAFSALDLPLFLESYEGGSPPGPCDGSAATMTITSQ